MRHSTMWSRFNGLLAAHDEHAVSTLNGHVVSLQTGEFGAQHIGVVLLDESDVWFPHRVEVWERLVRYRPDMLICLCHLTPHGVKIPYGMHSYCWQSCRCPQCRHTGTSPIKQMLTLPTKWQTWC